MGEIIDIRPYRLRKLSKLLSEARRKNLPLKTARDLKNEREAAILRHPAGKSRHE